jgi:hypothetical protein
VRCCGILHDDFARSSVARVGRVVFSLTKTYMDVQGYYQYHAAPGNTGQLRVFRRRVCRLWRSVPGRRSQRAQVGWDRLNPLLDGGFPPPVFCTPIPIRASTPFILGKSRMRRRVRTDLCEGRPAMVVPTATTGLKRRSRRDRTGSQRPERGYLTGAPGVDWKPPNNFRASGMVTVPALATLRPSFAQ